jgi:hypothetical protein
MALTKLKGSDCRFAFPTTTVGTPFLYGKEWQVSEEIDTEDSTTFESQGYDEFEVLLPHAEITATFIEQGTPVLEEGQTGIFTGYLGGTPPNAPKWTAASADIIRVGRRVERKSLVEVTVTIKVNGAFVLTPAA